MATDEIDEVINNIILAINKNTQHIKELRVDIVEQLDKLASGIDESKQETIDLLSGVVELLTAITDKSYRVNDLILAITGVVASHKKRREEEGEIVN